MPPIASLATSPYASRQGAAPSGPSTAGLQYALDRCERKLGDWQACPSRKTPEGQHIIQTLQNQIRSLQTRIQRADTNAPAHPRRADAASAPAAVLPSPVSGHLLDVYA